MVTNDQLQMLETFVNDLGLNNFSLQVKYSDNGLVSVQALWEQPTDELTDTIQKYQIRTFRDA